MATAAGVPRTLRAGARQEGAQPGWRDDLLTIGFGLWLLGGLFVDGWAHNNLRQLETFFTPWHALLYSGYGASALWLCWLVWRGVRAGRVGLAAVPRGYGLGFVGVVVFGLGGLADMLWHLTFGVERDLAALLSPTHLILFVGVALILTSPFRSAWGSPDPAGDAPRLRAFLPALLSLTATVSAASFMNAYYWGLLNTFHLQPRIRSYGGRPDAARLLNLSREYGLTGVLLTTAVLIAPVLLLLRRWRPPFGSLTIYFGLNTLLMNILVALRPAETIAVALATGLAADLLVRTLDLRPRRRAAGGLRLFAAAVPATLWGLFFLAGQIRWGVGWPAELWGGAIAMAALCGVGLSLLAIPPTLPDHLDRERVAAP